MIIEEIVDIVPMVTSGSVIDEKGLQELPVWAVTRRQIKIEFTGTLVVSNGLTLKEALLVANNLKQAQTEIFRDKADEIAKVGQAE